MVKRFKPLYACLPVTQNEKERNVAVFLYEGVELLEDIAEGQPAEEHLRGSAGMAYRSLALAARAD